MGATISQIFGRYGLALEPARGLHFDASLPELAAWLKVDKTKPHLTQRNPDGTPVMGGAKLYIFDDQAGPVMEEFESWYQDPDSLSKITKPKLDHAISTFLYFCTATPTYHEPTPWGGEIGRGDPRTITAMARRNMR
jgi:hypothetical protein